jgi:hypothetical protein
MRRGRIPLKPLLVTVLTPQKTANRLNLLDIKIFKNI